MNVDKLYSGRYNVLLGGISFIVLVVLAITFYKERVGISDTAYHLFTILKNDAPAIQNKRFVAILTQLFPLLSGKLQIPLQSTAMLYSASFVLVQCFVFFIINNVIKNPRFALGYLLFLTLMTAHTFFWVQSELPQGVSFMFLYFALFDKIKGKKSVGIINGIILFLLIITVAYSHPLQVFPFLFFHVFLFGNNKQLNIKLIIGALIYILVAAGRTLIFKAEYEATAFEGLNNFKYLFPNYFTIQSNKNFARYVFSDYYFLIIIFITNSIFYLRNKNVFKLFFSVAFFGGFLMLVNVCYHGGGNQFYFENQYLLLSIFVIIPFLYDVAPWLWQHKPTLFKAVPVIIIVVCLVRVVMTKSYYTNMLNWKRQAIENMSTMKDKRVLINKEQIPFTAMLDTWSNPYEFWFLSTLENGYSQATLVEETPKQFDHTTPFTDQFITLFEWTKYEDLKPLYFKYPSSTEMVRYNP